MEDHGPENPDAPVNYGEYDREGDMAKDDLRTIDDAAEELYSILRADDNLPEWVQSKITKAVDYIDTARDYMKAQNYEEGVAEGSGDNWYAMALKRHPQLKQVDREKVIDALNDAYEDYLFDYGYEGIGPDEEISLIDYAVKRLKQGVAEGSEIKIPTEDGITMQDIRLMAGEGKLTKKTVLQAIAVIRKQRRPKDVAESYDNEELANEVYAEFERIYPNLARRANERTVHAAILDVLNYGGDSNPSALAQDVARAVKRDMQQGMAEGDVDEAKYQGREVPLGKKMAGDVKKSKVYVRKPNGNIVKVNFGDKKMRIKKSNPARRKSFRARHNCANPGPRHKARYWSCRSW
jgi:hypothetical protein